MIVSCPFPWPWHHIMWPSHQVMWLTYHLTMAWYDHMVWCHIMWPSHHVTWPWHLITRFVHYIIWPYHVIFIPCYMTISSVFALDFPSPFRALEVTWLAIKKKFKRWAPVKVDTRQPDLWSSSCFISFPLSAPSFWGRDDPRPSTFRGLHCLRNAPDPLL